MFLNPSGSLYS
jgi:hypothetical protein